MKTTIAILIILGTICNLETKIDSGEINDVRDRYKDNFSISSDDDSLTDRIRGGDSNTQKEAEAERERERIRQINQSSQTLYKGSQSQSVRYVQRDYRSCVPFAKAKTGIHRPIGWGGRAGIQGQEAKVGAIAVERFRIHVGVVEAIEGDYLHIIETNYRRGWQTRRVLHKSEVRGYIYS